jgi:hypothetical protein
MMKDLKYAATLAMLLLLCASLTRAQSIQERCMSSKLQSAQPDVIISIEQVEVKKNQAGKLERIIWFRFRNNTGCKVVLLTLNQHVRFARLLKGEQGKPLKNENDGWQFDYTSDVIDNSQTSLDVYIYASNPAKGYHIVGRGDYHERFTQNLRSGESVLFQIHENSLKRGRNLSIEYTYEGEQWKESHHAIFGYSQPLKEAIKNLENLKTQHATN